MKQIKYMRLILLIIITVFFASSSIAQTKWKLVWSDEFNYTADKPDTTKWTEDYGNGKEQGNPGWGNGEWQNYNGNNVWVDGSKLVLKGEYKPGAGDCGGWGGFKSCDWQSGKVHTAGKYAKDYGLFEAKIKIPKGEGTWPAFWTLGDNAKRVTNWGNTIVKDGVTWPRCGEIDIMEVAALKADTVFGTCHWMVYRGETTPGWWGISNNGYSSAGPAQGRGARCDGPADCGDDYHLFQLEKTKDKLIWYVDWRKYAEFTIADAEDAAKAFNQGQFLILNLALGGTFAGTGQPQVSDFTASGGKFMYVDYVRVYEPTTGTDEYITSDTTIVTPPIIPPVADQLPFPNALIPNAIPGVIESGNYDQVTGKLGQGISYNDTSEPRQGTYRLAEGVDAFDNGIEGKTIGYITSGEWVEYTVDLATAGEYKLDLRYTKGWSDARGKYAIKCDGQQVGVIENVPNTNNGGAEHSGWDNWTTFSVTGLNLPKGTHILRLDFITEGLNMGKMTFSLVKATNTLTRIVVSPLSPVIKHNTTQQFNAIGYDQDNKVISITPKWEISGGTISNTGLFKATEIFNIKVKDGSVEDNATITVTE